MADQYAHGRSAKRTRGDDELTLAERERLRAHETTHAEPARARHQQGERNEAETSPERRDQDQHEQPRDRQCRVDEAHEYGIDRTADEARDRADRDAERHGEKDGAESDGERDPAAVEEAREHVATE